MAVGGWTPMPPSPRPDYGDNNRVYLYVIELRVKSWD